MASLVHTIDDVQLGFAANQGVDAAFARTRFRNEDGTYSFRTDVTVTFVVLATDLTTVLMTYTDDPVQGVPMDFSWYTGAYRAAAWARFLAKNGFTEGP